MDVRPYDLRAATGELVPYPQRRDPMRQLTLTLLSLVAVAGMLFVGPRQVFACSCRPPPANEAAARDLVASQELVIAGTVSSVEEIDGGVRARAKIDVTSWYGGTGPREITVYTFVEPGACGYADSRRNKPSHFLMLTRTDEGEYRASSCTSFPFDRLYLEDDDAASIEFERQVAKVAVPIRVPPPGPPEPRFEPVLVLVGLLLIPAATVAACLAVSRRVAAG